MAERLNILALTCAELADELRRRYAKGLYHATAIYRECFQEGVLRYGSAFTPALAARLAADTHWPECRIVARQEDEVVKFATALADGALIETVVIPARGRTTLCVSSQVGCRMGCRFCATGAMGFRRDLSVEEIVWQVHAARFVLGFPVDNIVFMGMGEPLDNFENVIQAVRVIGDQRGFAIAPSHITLSTAGHAEGIRRLAEVNLPRLRLAVSLNAVRENLRSELMPINQKYPLAVLKEALEAYAVRQDAIVFVEYVLLAGINDTRTDADALAHYLNGLPVRVNVIAYNGGGAYRAPTPEAVRTFCAWLAEDKVFVRARPSRGRNILAACGQLGASLGRQAPE